MFPVLLALMLPAQAGGLSLADLETGLARSLEPAFAQRTAALLARQKPVAAKPEAGVAPRVEGERIAWAIKAPPTAKCGVALKSGVKFALLPLGATGWHAAVTKTPRVALHEFTYGVDGAAKSSGRVQAESYVLGKDSLPQPGVPKGQVVEMGEWKSTIFPGTVRQWWVYVPPGYDPNQPPALMVFFDGGGYVKGDGAVPVVFDNLIHQRRMPKTLGVFVNPGGRPGEPRAFNRSNEYDTCTARNALFLEREILPEVAKKWRFAADPKRRAVGGASSGGSAAFTAAWHRPDLFGRVFSWIGSYCDFRGLPDYPALPGGPPSAPRNEFGPFKTAHDYPALLRKTQPPKPLRVYLQEGSRDLDNQLGNWPLANRQMAAALEYSKYQWKLVMGEGFHSHAHGRAVMPEGLEWLWRDD